MKYQLFQNNESPSPCIKLNIIYALLIEIKYKIQFPVYSNADI